mgnify:CR=1 FL=1
MKAVRIHNHGGLDVLKYDSLDEPICNPNKIKIKIKAAALNHLDIWVRNGMPGIKIPLPLIMGSDGSGEIGLISSVSEPFCGDCVRARISADGRLFTCLFASGGHDLRALIHDTNGGDLTAAIAAIWQRRADRYSELRSEETSALPRIEMSYIGG